MSQDFERWILQQDPRAAMWAPGQPVTPEVRYRLLDAPMGRYLVGLGRRLGGFSAPDVNADWTWEASWEENTAALPGPRLLWAGRMPSALLGALATVLIFWIGAEVDGLGAGLVAAAVLGLDPLSLLHTRRAMSEGALIFFSALAAFGALRLAQSIDRRPRLSWQLGAAAGAAGALAGLAFCSKHSELVMLPLAMLAVSLPALLRAGSWRARLTCLGTLVAAIALGWVVVVWLLNPVLHAQPLAAVRAMVAQRAELVRQQIEVNGAARPASLTPTAGARAAAILRELYTSPPAFWDAPVYVDQLRPMAQDYLANPINGWLRAPGGGILLAALTTAGLAASARRLLHDRLGATTRAEQGVWTWALLSLAWVVLTIPLDWQRYFLPLLVPAHLFAAFGAAALARTAWQRSAPVRLRLARAFPAVCQ